MAKRFDVLGLIGLVLLVAIWQLLTFAIPLIALPHPAHVAGRIAEDFIVADYLLFYGLPETGLLDSMIYTTQNVLIAVALGASVGTVCGLVTARFDLIRSVIDPVLMVLGTIPILVLAPFFLIWFGTGRTSAVLLVAIYVAVILYIYAQRAASTLDPVYEDAAYTLAQAAGASSGTSSSRAPCRRSSAASGLH